MRKLKTKMVMKKVKEHRHRLSERLILSLIKLEKAGGRAIASEFLDSHTDINNFQKLKYWGFIEKHNSRFWDITSLGREFLKNNLRVSMNVITLENNPVEFEGDLITLDEIIKKHYDNRDFYDKMRDVLVEKYTSVNRFSGLS